MEKLELRGIQGSFLDMLKEIYRDVQCQVRVGEGSSGSFSVGRGLRQGCILSTTLFSLFIDDIRTSLKANARGVACCKYRDIDPQFLLFLSCIIP